MAEKIANMTSDALETKAENSRMSFYKKPISRDNYKLDVEEEERPQELRRQHLLASQKKSRDAAFNAGRAILEAALATEEENLQEMEVDRRFHRSSRRYRQYANKLMMSEWMLEVPEDYLEKWILVPCPEGRRSLVVACKGKTKAYNRHGERLGKFNSALPGGSSREHNNSCTILDCIWMKEQKKYYALDVLAWSNQPLLNCDAEFRLFWLKSQIEDTKELADRNTPRNSFPILPLPRVPCNENAMEMMEQVSGLEPLDGFLFFHREGNYTNGRTPLVTWLKPFMMDEVLGISVSESLDEKPDGYIDYRHYIESLKPKNKKFTDEMDVVNIEG